jgi:hypothetical protein
MLSSFLLWVLTHGQVQVTHLCQQTGPLEIKRELHPATKPAFEEAITTPGSLRSGKAQLVLHSGSFENNAVVETSSFPSGETAFCEHVQELYPHATLCASSSFCAKVFTNTWKSPFSLYGIKMESAKQSSPSKKLIFQRHLINNSTKLVCVTVWTHGLKRSRITIHTSH